MRSRRVQVIQENILGHADRLPDRKDFLKTVVLPPVAFGMHQQCKIRAVLLKIFIHHLQIAVQPLVGFRQKADLILLQRNKDAADPVEYDKAYSTDQTSNSL